VSVKETGRGADKNERESTNGGSMEFTEIEAKAKEGKWVRVRAESFLSAGVPRKVSKKVPKGTRGQIVYAQLLGTVDCGKVWAVSVQFYPFNAQYKTILSEHIRKEQYEHSLEEVEVDKR